MRSAPLLLLLAVALQLPAVDDAVLLKNGQRIPGTIDPSAATSDGRLAIRTGKGLVRLRAELVDRVEEGYATRRAQVRDDDAGRVEDAPQRLLAGRELRDALVGHNYVADYVQTLTHEVKSPLSAIRGAAELLQEDGMPPAERSRFLANITREAGRIQEIVDRMMELTALEARRTLDKAEAVPVFPLLQAQVAAAQDAAASRGIALELHAEGEDSQAARVLGDPFLLRRAVANLLDNAVDFSPDGGVVRMALIVTARQVCIHIQDQGPGIPPYAQAKVFEKFYSLARPHTHKKSTGLGLSFINEIASLHRGRIELANSASGQGAHATLSLPRWLG